ncbi:MAG TPA: GTPase Era [Alphaproteobacteria bacterium]|nr:GTPase Era [Alphaproteobacteria bacterium]
MTEPSAKTRCGFIALIGAPNAGKSTLLNALVGAKVAIVSAKPQTTRMRVLGIANVGASQLIYVDTPGIFSPKRRLDRAMVRAAWEGAGDADIVALVVDAARKKVSEDTREIVAKLKASDRPAVLILNKVDATEPPRLLAIAAELNADFAFSDTFMVSALTGDGLDEVRRTFAERVAAGPWLYPEDQLSDLPTRLLAAEITREQLYLQLGQELPYASTVEHEAWEEREDGSVAIRQAILVERPGQKAIVIGKGGTRIKAIGEAARKALTEFLDRPVHLFLHVKVQEKWADDPSHYREVGLDWKS